MEDSFGGGDWQAFDIEENAGQEVILILFIIIN